MYSEKVMDHFRTPEMSVRSLTLTVLGMWETLFVGILRRFILKLRGILLKISNLKHSGCGAAIASSSMLTEMAKGKTLEEALQITDEAVADMLDGLPSLKRCTAPTWRQMLWHKAIEDYRMKKEKVHK